MRLRPIPPAYMELIRAVIDRGQVGFECGSRKQAERIKSQFYRVRDQLLTIGDTRANDMMVSISSPEHGPVVLVVAMRTGDEELILNAIMQDSSPITDIDGQLNRLWTGLRTSPERREDGIESESSGGTKEDTSGLTAGLSNRNAAE